jgi:hypothetical protein
MPKPKFEKGDMVQIRKDTTLGYEGRRVKVLEADQGKDFNRYRFVEIFGYYPESHLKEPEPTIMENQYNQSPNK